MYVSHLEKGIVSEYTLENAQLIAEVLEVPPLQIEQRIRDEISFRVYQKKVKKMVERYLSSVESKNIFLYPELKGLEQSAQSVTTIAIPLSKNMDSLYPEIYAKKELAQNVSQGKRYMFILDENTQSIYAMNNLFLALKEEKVILPYKDSQGFCLSKNPELVLTSITRFHYTEETVMYQLNPFMREVTSLETLVCKKLPEIDQSKILYVDVLLKNGNKFYTTPDFELKGS